MPWGNWERIHKIVADSNDFFTNTSYNRSRDTGCLGRRAAAMAEDQKVWIGWGMPMSGSEKQARYKTIVLVTNQFQCERIIRSGRTLADITNTELCVFSVQNSRYPQNPLALEHLFNVSKQHGAVMNITYGEEPVKQIISFIKHTRTRNVLTGIPQDENSILYQVWRKFTHVQFFTVDEEGNTAEVIRSSLSARRQAGTGGNERLSGE